MITTSANLNCEEAKKPGIDRAVEMIASEIVDAAIVVHRELGAGLLESAYKSCLQHELESRKISVCAEVEVPLRFKGLRLDCGFRADLIVDDRVLVELKAVESLLPVHKAQLITYLKISKFPLGFLINFNTPLLKDGLHRFVRPDLLRSESA